MPRLLKSEAETTATSVVRATFQKRYTDAVLAYSKASHDFYDTFLGSELAVIVAAPEGHYEMEDDISFPYRGEYHYIRFDGKPYSRWNAGLRVEVPNRYRRIRRAEHSGLRMDQAAAGVDIRDLTRAAERLIDAEAEEKQVAEEMKTARDTLIAKLRAMGPVQKIASGWPEIVPYLPASALAPRPASTALVIPRAELNARFGLPVEV